MPKRVPIHPSAPTIRPATVPDLAAVERMEREHFADPWRRDYYEAELGNPRSHFHVVEEEGAVVGYILFWRLGAELELHRIAVTAARQRRGLAARLMEFFIEAGSGWGCERAFLEVRASNKAAIRLYEKFGFRPVGRRKNYYANPPEDARVFEFDY